MAVFILVVWMQASVMPTASALLVTGLFVGPTMVTAFTIAERRSPAGGTGVAMTAMQSAITVGVSLGAAGGGALAAANGATGAFLLAAAAALPGAIVQGRTSVGAGQRSSDLLGGDTHGFEVTVRTGHHGHRGPTGR